MSEKDHVMTRGEEALLNRARESDRLADRVEEASEEMDDTPGVARCAAHPELVRSIKTQGEGIVGLLRNDAEHMRHCAMMEHVSAEQARRGLRFLPNVNKTTVLFFISILILLLSFLAEKSSAIKALLSLWK